MKMHKLQQSVNDLISTTKLVTDGLLTAENECDGLSHALEEVSATVSALVSSDEEDDS